MGLLLDTNVVSELVKRSPSPAVTSWLARAAPDALFLGAPTIGEIVRGIETAPDAGRRRYLERWVREDLTQQFHDRILAFDRNAATVWGRLMGEGERSGLVPPVIDTQLAAIALAHGHAVATRDAVFERLGVERIDPWVEP